MKGKRLIMFVVFASSCSADPVRQEAQRVMQMTVPTGAESSLLSAPKHTGMAVEYTWTVSVTTPWPTYATWVSERLSGTFVCHEAPARVECVRRSVGDAFTIVLSMPDATHPRDVRGAFTARPD